MNLWSHSSGEPLVQNCVDRIGGVGEIVDALVTASRSKDQDVDIWAAAPESVAVAVGDVLAMFDRARAFWG